MPVKKVLAKRDGKPMASLAARSSRKLGTMKKLARPAKLNRPASLGAAAVHPAPLRRKPREQLGAVDKVLVELLSSLYRDLTSLLETFRRKLKALRLPLKR